MTFSTRQVADLLLVPQSKIYALRKNLQIDRHYLESRNSNNCKSYSFTVSGVSQIELIHWLKVGAALHWSQPRQDAFTRASKWLAEVAT